MKSQLCDIEIILSELLRIAAWWARFSVPSNFIAMKLASEDQVLRQGRRSVYLRALAALCCRRRASPRLVRTFRPKPLRMPARDCARSRASCPRHFGLGPTGAP
jgi:hypothetical protein